MTAKPRPPSSPSAHQVTLLWSQSTGTPRPPARETNSAVVSKALLPEDQELNSFSWQQKSFSIICKRTKHIEALETNPLHPHPPPRARAPASSARWRRPWPWPRRGPAPRLCRCRAVPRWLRRSGRWGRLEAFFGGEKSLHWRKNSRILWNLRVINWCWEGFCIFRLVEGD